MNAFGQAARTLLVTRSDVNSAPGVFHGKTPLARFTNTLTLPSVGNDHE